MAIGDSLAEYFTLNEATGNRIGSHAATTLADEGSTPALTGLTYGNAAHFTESSGQRLWIADNALFSMGDIDFTVGFSFYFDYVPGYNLMLCSKSHNGTGAEEWKVQIGPSGDLEFLVWDSGGSVMQVASTGIVSDATWHRALVFHDSVNNVVGCSLDNETPNTESWSSGVGNRDHDFQIGHNSMAGRIGPWALWKGRVLDSAARTEWDNGGSLLTYAAMFPAGFSAACATQANVVLGV